MKVAVARKTKIGRKVKGTPKVWTVRQRISEDDSEEVKNRKTLLNRVLLDRHPYFFIYRYKEDKKAYNTYYEQKQVLCKTKYNLSIEQLEACTNRTEEMDNWLDNYYRFCPVIISNSPMNMLCRYLEKVEADILQTIKNTEFDWAMYLARDYDPDEWLVADIIGEYESFKTESKAILAGDDKPDYIATLGLLKRRLGAICSNPRIVTNILVQYLYGDKPSASKDWLWDAYGKYIIQSAEEHNPYPLLCPVEDENGDLEYLGRRYTMKQIGSTQDIDGWVNWLEVIEQ